MKNLKNVTWAGLGLGLLAISNVALAASNWTTKWLSSNDFYKSADGNNSSVTTTTASLDTIAAKWISWWAWFLYFAAVIMWLWWAYNILTAWGDEDKVKKGKDIIIRAVLWLIAVFLVSSIMNFVIQSLFGQTPE